MASVANGKAKQYLAIIYMLAATTFIVVREAIPKGTTRANQAQQVLLNSNRITALETEMKNLREAIIQNRVENREEHRLITAKLDTISLAVRK